MLGFGIGLPSFQGCEDARTPPGLVRSGVGGPEQGRGRRGGRRRVCVVCHAKFSAARAYRPTFEATESTPHAEGIHCVLLRFSRTKTCLRALERLPRSSIQQKITPSPERTPCCTSFRFISCWLSPCRRYSSSPRYGSGRSSACTPARKAWRAVSRARPATRKARPGAPRRS
ncbi:hypothetical protein ANT2_0766 [plant metagenome]|uniref:Uncharacterized protein n=1 Tax=plant metagenome TaxID=1297885 RepID=A0A484V8N5_9ZZZZ